MRRGIRAGWRGTIGILLLAALFRPATELRAQVVRDSKAISIGYGAVDGEFSLGVRIAAALRPEFGVEVAGEFVPARGDFSDLYTRALFQAYLRPGSRLVPVLSAGAGTVTVVGMGDRETDFAVSFGGGLRGYLSEGLAARVDVEGHVVYLDRGADLRPGVLGGIVFLF